MYMNDCKKIKTNHNRFFQSGITMVEALVSLFVFSVGALGLAAMQTAALVQGDDSRQRSLVIWKAQEFADRIRSTRSSNNPAGLSAEFITNINNSSVDTIGTDVVTDAFDCSGRSKPEAFCSDQNDSSKGAVCTTDQLVEFDVWDVFCNPQTGLATSGIDAAGSTGIQQMEVVLRTVGDDFELYIEWVARTVDNDENLNSDRTVTTSLCGNDFEIQSTLDAYCLRFQ